MPQQHPFDNGTTVSISQEYLQVSKCETTDHQYNDNNSRYYYSILVSSSNDPGFETTIQNVDQEWITEIE